MACYERTPKSRERLRRYARTLKSKTKVQRRYAQGVQVIYTWKEAHNFKCMDCSHFFHPFQLQADHRPGTIKRAEALRRNWAKATLEAELAKCDCVCANCHALRTHVRFISNAQKERTLKKGGVS